MPRRKDKTPTIEAFFDDAAGEYAGARWMQRIQRATTARAIQLLSDDPTGGPLDVATRAGSLVLDAGCGNGFSTRVLEEHGFTLVVGMDVSLDMLAMNPGGNLVLGDLACLPFRAATLDVIVSISAMNFVAEGKLDRELPGIYACLARDMHDAVSAGGRVIIEFYPRSPAELDAITSGFGKATSGFDAFLVVDKPGTRKEQKFLLLGRYED